MNKFQRTEVLLASLTLTVFAAGTVFAAPPGPPPTPNAPSASFSSVSVAPTSGTGVSITGASGSPAVLATSPDTYGIQGSTSSTTAAGVYGTSGTGYGVIGVGNAVNKAGVYGSSTNANGVYGSGGGNGVLGVSGGAFPSAGVYGLSTNASGIGLYGVNSGAAGTGIGIYGYSANNDGMFGYSNSKNGLWGRSNDATGTYAGVYGYSGASTGVSGYTNTGTAGKFQNTTSGGLVNLASNSYALDVAGAPSRFNTAVDLQGAISNSSVLNAGYVRFNDNIVMDPGRQLYTSTVRGETYDSATNTSQTTSLGLVGFPDVVVSASGGQIKLNGQLAGLSPNAVTVKDPQGFAIENYSGSGNPAGTLTLQITENGELANTTSSPITIRDDDGFVVKNIFGSQTFLNINNKGQTTINGPGSGDFWLDTLTLNTASYGGAALDANNTNTSSGFGVRGSGTIGVSGSGSVVGVSGSASGTGSGVSGNAPSTSGQGGLFYNGLYTVQLATPTYGINSSGPVYATSTATGLNATITANLPASYNGNGINATVNNASSYGVYSNNSAGGYAYYGIGNMYLSGTPYKPGGGSWIAPSDLRLKDVKSNYQRGLDAILKLNPIVYNYKADNAEKLPSDKEYVGLAAQEVEKVIPEAVNTDKLGYLNINNDPIIWTMLNSIKDLANKFIDLETEIAQLKKVNSELSEKVTGLEERLAKLEQK